MALVLFILIVLLIKISLFVYLSPVIIGIAVIALGGKLRRGIYGVSPSVWWKLSTGAVTALSTLLFWKDLLDDTVDYSAVPFTLLIIYSVVSLCLLAFTAPKS